MEDGRKVALGAGFLLASSALLFTTDDSAVPVSLALAGIATVAIGSLVVSGAGGSVPSK